MPRWNELPESLDERARQLIVQLRRLKDRSGLSLSSLQSKTGYSRSSWERYLNGRSLPPRQAVEQLARVAGADPARLLVLHEVAATVWQPPTATDPQTATDPPTTTATDPTTGTPRTPGTPAAEGAPGGTATGTATGTVPPGRDGGSPAALSAGGAPRALVRRSVAATAAVAAALLGLGAGVLTGVSLTDDGTAGAADSAGGGASETAQPGGPQPDHSASPTGGRRAYVYELGKSYPCDDVHRSSGKGGGLSAGYSTTRTAVLAGPGWDVVEAQCLLRHRHLDPGVVDGVYGQQTIKAVARLQEQAGLPADGIVGPHTWRVLRK